MTLHKFGHALVSSTLAHTMVKGFLVPNQVILWTDSNWLLKSMTSTIIISKKCQKKSGRAQIVMAQIPAIAPKAVRIIRSLKYQSKISVENEVSWSNHLSSDNSWVFPSTYDSRNYDEDDKSSLKGPSTFNDLNVIWSSASVDDEASDALERCRITA